MGARVSAVAPRTGLGVDLLVVDQDPATRALLRQFLARAGFATDEAPDADTALARGAWSEPAAIVLHDGVSGEEGLEILRVLRAQHPAVPVVFIAEFGARARAAVTRLALPASLAKLLRVSQLLTTVRRALAAESGVRRPLAPCAGPAGGDPARELAGVRVLIVEDDLDAGDAAALLLEDLGARVGLVRDGAEALAMLAGDPLPDVILCDLQMPGLDGFELIARLRADPRRAGVPVIAVSGLARAADYERTRAAGFAAHLSKPFDEHALVSAVRGIMGSGPPASWRIADSSQAR